jgi:TonB family protein
MKLMLGKGRMCAGALFLLLAGVALPSAAQSVERKGVKGEAGEEDAALKHDLVLHFDECKVPENKTFTAEVQVQVTPAGLPAMVMLSQSSGYACLDDVAVAAIKVAQFTPAREHGRPVVREVVMPVDFTRVNMAQSDGLTATGARAAEVLSKPRLEVGSCKVKAGATARAVVGLRVNVQGKPTEVHVVQTTGDACLDGVALRNAAGYLFNPAQRNGKPVDFEMKIEMVFE